MRGSVVRRSPHADDPGPKIGEDAFSGDLAPPGAPHPNNDGFVPVGDGAPNCVCRFSISRPRPTRPDRCGSTGGRGSWPDKSGLGGRDALAGGKEEVVDGGVGSDDSAGRVEDDEFDAEVGGAEAGADADAVLSILDLRAMRAREGERTLSIGADALNLWKRGRAAMGMGVLS